MSEVAPDFLHEHGTRIKSLEVLLKWVSAVVGALIVGGIWIVNIRHDVDSLQVEIREHAQAKKSEERAIVVMQTQLEGIVSTLNKIDRKINP